MSQQTDSKGLDTIKTRIISLDKTDPIVLSLLNGETPSIPDEHPLSQAKRELSSGNTIGIPTETVYGLAANAFNEDAIRKIFVVKGRPSDNPLIVHISSRQMLKDILPEGYEIPHVYQALIERFWPGPLTLLFPRSDKISRTVSAGHETIAIRMPSHPIARALIQACGFPLAAPSANLSGRPSPTIAEHVIKDLNGRIPLVIDGGQSVSGVESTVFDGLRPTPAILRPGGITFEQLRSCPGCETVSVYSKHFSDPELAVAPTTPGMKYLHYTPSVPVVLFEIKPSSPTSDSATGIMMENDQLWAKARGQIWRLLAETMSEYKRVGYMSVGKTSFQEYLSSKQSSSLELNECRMGLTSKDVAHRLFSSFRALETQNVEVILVEGISEDEEGLAVMNRLRKAAFKVIEIKL